MNTNTSTKRIARKVADNTGISYQEARALVSDTVNDLGIGRVFNFELHTWEIERDTANQLVDFLSNDHL